MSGRLIVAVLLVSAVFGVGRAQAQVDFDCPDFQFQEDAQAFFETAGLGDPHNLDADNDDIACEDLPHRSEAAAEGARSPRTPRVPRRPGEPRPQAAATATPRPTARAGLPKTGTDTRAIGFLGSGFVLIGGLLVIASRRSRVPVAVRAPVQESDDYPLIGW